MASPTFDWRDKLKSHPICKLLKDSISSNRNIESVKDSKSLLAIKNGDLFIWNSFSANVAHCNLKGLLGSASDSRFQVLMCTDAPHFEVEGLAVNACCSHLLVWGTRGITVLELPQRWGKLSQFEGGKETITCRTVSVGARHLAGSQGVQVRQVSWHPGSSCSSHLAVLTSDNIFSVYSLADSERPLSSSNLQPGQLTCAFTSPSKLNISAALGETAVAFTFGPPQELRPVRRAFQPPPSPHDLISVWPVFVLKGSGDILLTYSEVLSNRPVQLATQGPLVMCPPAQDNYGVDACSILTLHTSPPILVMATCSGSLHHCLVLPSADHKESEVCVAPDLPRFTPPSQPTLYVLETVELELSLTDGALDPATFDLSHDPFTCPIKLKKDPLSPDRYHCCHAAGVHTVALPWLPLLQHFLDNDCCEFVIPEEEESVVEHLICTKPLYSSPAAPVWGMDIVSEPTLAPTLLVLGQDCSFTALAMSHKYRSAWSQFLRGESGASGGPEGRGVQGPPAQSFISHITNILRRSASHPLLMAGPRTEGSQHALYQLLMRVTQVLRQEYVQKQEHAHRELHTRVRILREQKQQQLAELRALEQRKEALRDKAGELGERLESCHDNQQLILERLEKVMRKLQTNVPLLSLAEKELSRELKDLQQKVIHFNSSLAQLRCKQEYQQRQLNPSPSPSPSPSPAPSASPSLLRSPQLLHIKDILKEEGDQIQVLMKQVSQLKIETSS